jgi:hypothetical protein
LNKNNQIRKNDSSNILYAIPYFSAAITQSGNLIAFWQKGRGVGVWYFSDILFLSRLLGWRLLLSFCDHPSCLSECALARSLCCWWMGITFTKKWKSDVCMRACLFFVFRSHRVFRTRGVSVRESERVSFALLRRNNVAAGSKKNCVSSTHISLSPLHFHISLPRQGERGEIACTRAAWSEPLMLCSLFPNSSFRGDRCPVPQITFQSDICLRVGSGTWLALFASSLLIKLIFDFLTNVLPQHSSYLFFWNYNHYCHQTGEWVQK